MSDTMISFRKALASIPANERYNELPLGGSLTVGIYAPHESDEPHVPETDVVYLVVNGSGFFVTDDERQPFSPGDLLFAAQGTERHFEKFTPDFAVWVIAAG